MSQEAEVSENGEKSDDGPGADQSRRPNPGIGGEDEFGGIFDDIASAATSVVETVASPVTAAVDAVAHVDAKDVARFAANAARAAGHGAHSLVKVASQATGAIADAAGSIPYVGPGFRAAIGAATEPFKFAEAVANGDRIDRAAMSSLKRSIQDVRDVAPYVKAVVAFVPGVGTGLAAGIGAGVALSEGRPISQAVVDGIRDSLPGGAVARGAFDVAVAATRGDDVAEAALSGAIDALPVSPDERQMVRGAVDVAQAAATGKPLDDVALRAAVVGLPKSQRDIAVGWIGKKNAQSKIYDALTKSLPPDARKALAVGVAVGSANAEQVNVHRSVSTPQARDALVEAGRKVIAKSAVFRDAESRAPDKTVFALGAGVMSCSKVPGPAIMYLRDSLPKGRQRLSFDSALSIHVGAAISEKFSKSVGSKTKVGYYAVVGSLTGARHQRKSIVATIARRDPAAMAGAAMAVKHVRASRSLWRRFVAWIRKAAA